MNDILKFLIEGRKLGYARNDSYGLNEYGEKVIERNLGRGLVYRDSYNDGIIEMNGIKYDVFSGREVVSFNGKVFFVVNYSGKILLEFKEKGYKFLRVLMSRALKDEIVTRLPNGVINDLKFKNFKSQAFSKGEINGCLKQEVQFIDKKTKKVFYKENSFSHVCD